MPFQSRKRSDNQDYYHSWGAFDRQFVPQADSRPSSPAPTMSLRRRVRETLAEPSVYSESLLFEPTPYDYDEIPAPELALSQHTTSYTTEFRPASRNTERTLRRPMAPEPYTVSGGPSHAASSSSGSEVPATPQDCESLDNIWDQVRHRKVRELQGQPSKVASLRTHSGSGVPDRANDPRKAGPVPRSPAPRPLHLGSPAPRPMQLGSPAPRPLHLASPAPRPLHLDIPSSITRTDSHRRRRETDGVVHFEDSTDGQWAIATFMLGVPKRDIDASFKADRFTVSWHTIHETERVEGRMVYRERAEKHHSRTIQVPEKTKFEDIKASYHPSDGRLIIKYPKARTVRARPSSLKH